VADEHAVLHVETLERAHQLLDRGTDLGEDGVGRFVEP
jgi:hypothetical protein